MKLILLWLVTLLPLRAEWYLSAYTGATSTANSALRIDQPGRNTQLELRPVVWRDRSLSAPLYYGYRTGYGWRHFALEGEFIHTKAYAQTDRTAQITGRAAGAPVNGTARIDSVVQRFNISHGVNLVLLNGVWRYGLWRETRRSPARLLLTARAGAGVTVPHPESTVLGESRERYQYGRPAWQVGGGAEYRLWRGLHALAEYKFTRTRQRVDIVAGEAEALLRTHHGVFGLSWHFY
jgi:opacity protein-like surface antigen